MNTPINPLTAEHWAQIEQGLRAIHDYRQLAGKAMSAGVDMSVHNLLADDLETKLASLRNVFFPKGKP